MNGAFLRPARSSAWAWAGAAIDPSTRVEEDARRGACTGLGALAFGGEGVVETIYTKIYAGVQLAFPELSPRDAVWQACLGGRSAHRWRAPAVDKSRPLFRPTRLVSGRTPVEDRRPRRRQR